MEEKISKVKEIFLKTCENSELSKYGWKEYEFHTGIVEKLALQLAEKLKADKLIVQLSALLHDIGRIKYGPKEHERRSAEEAEKILKELGFEENIIEKVKECILLHRHSNEEIPKSLEGKILKAADAYSHFQKPLPILLFKAKFHHNLEEIIEWFKNKLERDLQFLKKIEKDLEIKEWTKEAEEKLEHFKKLT